MLDCSTRFSCYCRTSSGVIYDVSWWLCFTNSCQWASMHYGSLPECLFFILSITPLAVLTLVFNMCIFLVDLWPWSTRTVAKWIILVSFCVFVSSHRGMWLMKSRPSRSLMTPQSCPSQQEVTPHTSRCEVPSRSTGPRTFPPWCQNPQYDVRLPVNSAHQQRFRIMVHVCNISLMISWSLMI